MKIGRVVINYNICDNAKECSGIEACPTGAMFWNEEEGKIDYRAGDCIDCGKCEGACPVGAILWGTDDEDYEHKRQQVAEETRTLEELNVERYGAAPIDECIEISEVAAYLQDNKDNGYLLLEVFNDASIYCLLHSIRVKEIKEIFGNDLLYVVGNEYLIVMKNGAFSGVVEGYYDDENKEEFFKLLTALK